MKLVEKIPNTYIVFIFFLVVCQLHQTVTTLAQDSVQFVLVEMNIVAKLLRGSAFGFLQINQFQYKYGIIGNPPFMRGSSLTIDFTVIY